MTCHQEQTTLLSSYFDRRLVNLGLDSAKQEQLIRRFSLLNHDSGEFRSRIWIHDEWNCSRVVYTIMPYQNRPVVCNNARLKSQSLEVEYHLASEISVILSWYFQRPQSTAAGLPPFLPPPSLSHTSLPLSIRSLLYCFCLAEHYAPLVSSTLHSMDKEYEWMMKSPEALGLLCHLTRNEEAYERVATITLLYKSALLLYPFLYCLKNGAHPLKLCKHVTWWSCLPLLS